MINFYKGTHPIRGKRNYYLNDIIGGKWTDYDLQTEDYMDWLFPTNFAYVPVFHKDRKVRANVILATIRMLLFYGYKINPEDWSVEQVKPLGRKEDNIWVGLYNEKNYAGITHILKFLNQIEMSFLSVIIFRAMCEAMKTDSIFKQKVKKTEVLPDWMDTQKFLQEYKDGYDMDRLDFNMGSEEVEWMEEVENSERSESEVESEVESEDESEDECVSFRGLNYTGNSCYQDSTLLGMLAVPNDIITRYILLSDIKEVSDLPKKWTVCDEDPEKDYKLRKNIQDELIRITNSTRKVGNLVKSCSNLRRLIAKCPGTEEFHGTGMQDAGEFLSYIFNLFQIDVATTTNKTYITNDLTPNPTWLKVSNITDKNASPIIPVQSWHIEDSKDKQINEFLVQIEDSVLDNPYIHNGEEYIRRRRIWKMKKSPYIVFYIHRLHRKYEMIRGKFKVKEKKLRTSILPVQKIERLNLSAIVVHSHNHYTYYIKCRGIWFYYDDNPSEKTHAISRLGSYDEMIKHSPNPLKDGTLYFYT